MCGQVYKLRVYAAQPIHAHVCVLVCMHVEMSLQAPVEIQSLAEYILKFMPIDVLSIWYDDSK
jgi:hypothetical protein